MVVSDVTQLVKTIPPTWQIAAVDFPVILYFDKEPLAVTVNGTAARVEGTRASWCFPHSVALGDQLFHIKWTNPDGSPNVGTSVRLTVDTVDRTPPAITAGSVFDGAADVDPDPLNRDGIRYDFDEPIIGLKAKLLTEDGEDLGWVAVWDGQGVHFRLGANGKLLENGRYYMSQLVFAPAWIHKEFVCDCMDCSLWNTELTIGFITVGK